MAQGRPTAPVPWEAGPDGVTLALKLTPRSDRDSVDGVSTLPDGRPVLLARVRAVAEKGKANEAARRLVAAVARKPASAVDLVSGATSRLKLFRIAGEPAAIATALETTLRDREAKG